MSIPISLFILLFITTVQCQNRMVNSINTNIGTCSCDLNKGSCDVSCCCDTDCSAKDMKAFNCNSKSSADTNTISSKSTVQSTCFKDLSIFRSNSPYVIQKKGDLVCVDHERDTNNEYYQKMINQEIDSSVLPRSINIDNSVPSPLGTAIDLTNYQVGNSVFRYIETTNKTSYYSLPVKLFNSRTCSGLQPITYLNDFTSTCAQPVSQSTCDDALDATKYINDFCLIMNPSTLTADLYGTATNSCCTGSGSSSIWTAGTSTCSSALQNLVLTIFYLNPSGIVACNISLNTSGSSTSTVQQTFTVRFVKNGSSTSGTSRSGNPGYLQGAPIIAGNANGNSITTIPDLTILQASTSGDCSGTDRKSINFGQNVQSTCLFSPINNGSCPNMTDLSSIFVPYNFVNLYVAAYGNPDPANITGYWLPVTFCTSEIGSANAAVCQLGAIPSPSAGQCYIRLDIQIAYANIGSVTNPQPVLGAVIFHYQRIITTSVTSLLMTQTVTFQDISNAPATEGDQIPRPNTRLPGDFFYPFSLNQATNSIAFSSVFYLLIIVFILM